jgi:Tol biopolymer transport system component
MISIINVDGSGLRRVTPGTAPAWSPDGQHLTFEHWETRSVYVVDVDSGNRRVLYRSDRGAFRPDWSPDGRRIVFDVGVADDPGVTGLWTARPDGSEAQLLRLELSDVSAPVWSPGGDAIAYITMSGVGVVNADGTGREIRVTGSMSRVRWTPDGQLVYSKYSDYFKGPTRIYINGAAGERQLIPEATSPARADYSDGWVAWRR